MTTLPVSETPEAPTDRAPATEPHPVSSPESDLWIFRAGGKTVSGSAILAELRDQISRMRTDPESLVDAVILAGQFESALADAASADARRASCLTDQLAWRVVSREVETQADVLAARIQPPELIRISPPEGFTYYALHPADFSTIVASIPPQPASCAVIGIRSIGTTLSAMTAAGLRADGRRSSRITVRPSGHPYARTMELSGEERRWIQEQSSSGSQFLIVDEGPGRSGSTFLSVAEALVRTGVPRELITILGSRQPNPESLYAPEAASRWKEFRFLACPPSVSTLYEGYRYIGGGEWRALFLSQRADWPESWTQMERLKFIAPDLSALVKFEGMGAIGRETRERAFSLAEAGFSPRVMNSRDGFLEYALVPGKRLGAADLSTRILDELADYCAFRACHFRSSEPVSSVLREMLQCNLQQEFGVEMSLEEDELVSDTPVVCDGRMQPYEWIVNDAGRLLKTDGVSHGDDHFFPGPTDIAWDLAGAAIEWKLGADALAYLVEQFRWRSGTDVSRSLPLYLLAYSVFRLGFSKMAISTVPGSEDEDRLIRAYGRYRHQASHLIPAIIGA